MSKRAVIRVGWAYLVAAMHLPESTSIVDVGSDDEGLLLTIESPGLQEVADDGPLPLIEPRLARSPSGRIVMADWGYEPGRVCPPKKQRRRKGGEG
jgi:hypothetical protein